MKQNQQLLGKGSSLIDGEAASRAASTTEVSKASLKSEQGERGRDAASPSQIPALGWKDIRWRLWEEFNKDRVLLVAAGATFYLLLALFPALAAFISIYGFVADPVTAADHVAYLGGLLPSGGLDLIRGQLQALASQKPGALRTGCFVGLGIALWSANSGMKALFDAMNIAYEEGEKRSFITLNLMSILFTAGALMIGIVLLLTVTDGRKRLFWCLAGQYWWARCWPASRCSTASVQAGSVRNGAGSAGELSLRQRCGYQLDGSSRSICSILPITTQRTDRLARSSV